MDQARQTQAPVLLEVVCLTCGGQVVAKAQTHEKSAELLLQSAHYNAHPHPHGLMLRVGEEWPPPGTSVLEMACKAESCGSRFPRTLRYAGPAHLLGAMSICFHSMHEGHPLEMRVDGQLLFPSL